MPRRLIVSVGCGQNLPGNQSWSTEYVPSNLETVAITGITVKLLGSLIRGLKVHYNDGEIRYSYNYNEIVTTSSSGTVSEIPAFFDSDEWIVKIEGSTVSMGSMQIHALSYLKFVSNKGRTYGPYGGKRSTTNFSIEAPEQGFGVLWLNGCIIPDGTIVGYISHQAFINMLQATFATFENCVESLSFLRLETSSRSAFFRHLLSPIATLHVGTPAEVITVHESIVRNVPFFTAALHSGFLEASSKTIKMPDDDPAIVAALIEYLATGAYTYASADTLISGVDQALFHLKLHAVANKYDCPTLRTDAMKALHVVLRGLSSTDSLTVWKEGYELGMSIEEIETAPLNIFKPKIKDLFTNHAQEVSDILDDTPALAKDLLKLMAMEC